MRFVFLLACCLDEYELAVYMLRNWDALAFNGGAADTPRDLLFLTASLSCFAFILSTRSASIPFSLYHCSYCCKETEADISWWDLSLV